VPGEYNFITDGSSATLDGDAMTLSDDRFLINSGDADGLNVTISGNGANTTVYIGTSLLEKMQDYTKSMTKFNGTLNERVREYNSDVSDYYIELDELDAQIEMIRKEYISRFAGMDVALASLNRTGDSLEMMMEGWKKMNQ
jgi:flagellar hook-associated protein 2